MVDLEQQEISLPDSKSQLFNLLMKLTIRIGLISLVGESGPVDSFDESFKLPLWNWAPDGTYWLIDLDLNGDWSK